MKKFTIEMNEQHMQVMTAALETLTRLLMGQIDIVFEQVPGTNYEDRQLMQNCSRQLPAFSHLHPNASYGIGNEKLDDRANVAYEMKGLIEIMQYEAFVRQKISDETMQQFDRCFRKPLKVSKEPFIKIEEQKEFKLDKWLLDLSKIPAKKGCCENCEANNGNTCELKEILKEHRTLQKLHGTEFYQEIDPGGWDEWSIDEPDYETDQYQEINITWCPCQIKKNY